MATKNQIQASQFNGARSQGPVTAEGKTRSARNSTKHGAYSKSVVLHNEDLDDYNEFRDELLAAWKPADPREYDFVIDIVDARWRLNRFGAFETAAIDFEVQRISPEISQAFETVDETTLNTFAFNSLIAANRTFEVLQSAMRNQHRIIDRATTQLLRLQKSRAASATEPSAAFVADLAPQAEENARNEPEPSLQPTTAQLENPGNEPESGVAPSTELPSANDILAVYVREWMAANMPNPRDKAA
ncbi:MAG: hypothetical protein SGI92_01255 [Bryobacteraceae bacterium]|nr:hypothetical protein [Bryobacteraceae bacterium]